MFYYLEANGGTPLADLLSGENPTKRDAPRGRVSKDALKRLRRPSCRHLSCRDHPVAIYPARPILRTTILRFPILQQPIMRDPAYCVLSCRRLFCCDLSYRIRFTASYLTVTYHASYFLQRSTLPLAFFCRNLSHNVLSYVAYRAHTPCPTATLYFAATHPTETFVIASYFTQPLLQRHNLMRPNLHSDIICRVLSCRSLF